MAEEMLNSIKHPPGEAGGGSLQRRVYFPEEPKGKPMVAKGGAALTVPAEFDEFERRFSEVAFKPTVRFEEAWELGSGQSLLSCSIQRWKAVLSARYLVVVDHRMRVVAFADAGLDEAAGLRNPLRMHSASFDALRFASHCKEKLAKGVDGFHSVFPRYVRPAEAPSQWVGLMAVVTSPDSGMHQYRCASKYPGDSVEIERLENAW